MSLSALDVDKSVDFYSCGKQFQRELIVFNISRLINQSRTQVAANSTVIDNEVRFLLRLLAVKIKHNNYAVDFQKLSPELAVDSLACLHIQVKTLPWLDEAFSPV